MKDEWASFEVTGNPSFKLARKLRLLKEQLKIWNREVFGNINIKVQQALEEVRILDAKEGEGSLSRVEADRRAVIKEELRRLLVYEEIFWRQKSRVQSLKERDNNTKYFHRMANAHKVANHIRRVRIDGDILDDSSEIKEGIAGYYERLYVEDWEWRPKLDGLNFKSLATGDRDLLEEPFQVEEVVAALCGMSGDKAPGPDGFTMAFFQHCWEVLKGDIMEVFHYFYENECFEKSFNASFITLIPKKKVAEDIKDFRPISLIGGVYKIIAKVLSLRLRRVVGGVVSESQHAFVGDRQILDASLIANEVVDARLRSGEPGLCANSILRRPMNTLTESS